MAEASPHLGAYALFMFLTGARPGEATAIDRDRDLNLQARTVIIRETKIRNERKAHLPVPLVAALANLPVIPGRPLFIYRRPDDLMEAWDRAIERAGIQRLTPHCCRHGFATALLRAGVDVITVAWLGGWESPEHVLRTYGHALKKRDLTDVFVGTDLTQALGDVAKNARKS
jgi:integrase